MVPEWCQSGARVVLKPVTAWDYGSKSFIFIVISECLLLISECLLLILSVLIIFIFCKLLF